MTPSWPGLQDGLPIHGAVVRTAQVSAQSLAMKADMG